MIAFISPLIVWGECVAGVSQRLRRRGGRPGADLRFGSFLLEPRHEVDLSPQGQIPGHGSRAPAAGLQRKSSSGRGAPSHRQGRQATSRARDAQGKSAAKRTTGAIAQPGAARSGPPKGAPRRPAPSQTKRPRRHPLDARLRGHDGERFLHSPSLGRNDRQTNCEKVRSADQ